MKLCTLGTGMTSDIQRLKLFSEHDHHVRCTECNWGSYRTHTGMFSPPARERFIDLHCCHYQQISECKVYGLKGIAGKGTLPKAVTCMFCCITADEDLHARASML